MLLVGIAFPKYKDKSADNSDNPDESISDGSDLDSYFDIFKYSTNTLYWGKMLPTYIPANNSILVVVTQIVAMLSFFAIFSADSTMDVIAVITGEKKWKPSNLCRWFQGMLACSTTVVLVMTTSDATDTFLNVTAVNLILEFDEKFTVMAQKRWFGETLGKYVDKTKLPLVVVSKETRKSLSRFKVHDLEFGARGPKFYVFSFLWIIFIMEATES